MFIKLADNWSEKMCIYLEQPEKKNIYALGISVLLFYLVTFGLMMILSLCLRTLPATLVILLAFGVFRQFAGGAHLQEMLHCTIVTNVLIVGSSYLVTQGYLTQIFMPFFICTLFFNIVALARWVPTGTVKKPLTDPVVRRKMWRNTLMACILWTLLIIVCIHWQQFFYALALVMGNFMAICLLCPWGYRFLQILHKIFTCMNRKHVVNR